MLGRLPGLVAARAAAGELGRVESVHRARRRVPRVVVRVVAGVAAAVASAACQHAVPAGGPPVAAASPGPSSAGTPTATTSTTPPPTLPPAPSPTRTTTPPTPDSVAGYDAVCTGAKFRGAAAYKGGRGPHPITLADIDPPDPDGYGRGYDPGLSNIPFTWKGFGPKEIQLVACVHRTLGKAVIAHCKYSALHGDSQVIDVPMVSAVYSIVLRAARTGRQVARFSVRGQGRECLELISTGQFGGPPQQSTSLTGEQLSDLFGQYVRDRDLFGG